MTISTNAASTNISHKYNLNEKIFDKLQDTGETRYLVLKNELELFNKKYNDFLDQYNFKTDAKNNLNTLNCLKVELGIFLNKCLDENIGVEINEISSSTVELLETINNKSDELSLGNLNSDDESIFKYSNSDDYLSDFDLMEDEYFEEISKKNISNSNITTKSFQTNYFGLKNELDKLYENSNEFLEYCTDQTCVASDMTYLNFLVREVEKLYGACQNDKTINENEKVNLSASLTTLQEDINDVRKKIDKDLSSSCNNVILKGSLLNESKLESKADWNDSLNDNRIFFSRQKINDDVFLTYEEFSDSFNKLKDNYKSSKPIANLKQLILEDLKHLQVNVDFAIQTFFEISH
ncbi:MAG TPA: hypothetical protein VGP47_08295, partial [Parachlamydiaceae bacterium]|nr:hypothetical protein [Parachlamydiaceae bacterium]